MRFDDDALARFDRGIWLTIPVHPWVRFGLECAAAIGASAALYGVPFGPTLYNLIHGPGDHGADVEVVWDEDEPIDEEDGYVVEIPDDLDIAETEPPPPPPDPPPVVVHRVKAPVPDPLPEVVPPPVEPPPADTDEPVADVSDAPDENAEEAEIDAQVEKKRNRPPKKPKKTPPKGQEPCEVSDGIRPLADGRWLITRELVEFYANHPFQLDQLASVWTHKDAAGEPDGFKIGLPRCTVLRQAGFRSADVVNDVNGRVISTIPQAIGAYFALRREEVYYVHVSRRDPKTKEIKKLELVFEIEEKERKRKRRERDSEP